MAKAHPSFDIYPGDYLRRHFDELSLEAQAVWLRMEWMMHDSGGRYGYLEMAGKPLSDERIARRLEISTEKYQTILAELEEADWIQREAYTRTIFSEALIKQADKRAGTRERVNRHRNKHQTSDQTSGQTRTNLREKSDELFSENDSKSLETQEECNAGVTAEKRACTGRGRGGGRGEASSSFSSPEKPKASAIRELPTEVLPPGQLAADHVRDALDPNSLELLVEEIALASPAGVALNWSPLSIHGKTTIVMPILQAVELEANEQGLGKRQAALWLLKQVRAITEAVSHEPGWKRFWTQGRMVRFYDTTEYRNTERFTTGAGGTSNGRSDANATPRRSATDGNDEARRRLLEGEQPPHGDRAGAPEPGGRAAGGHEQTGGGGGIHRGARGPEPRGMHRGVQPSAGDSRKVVTLPRPIAAVGGAF